MDRLITEASKFLSGAPFRWAFCGGYALDLFLDRTMRIHGDIDICVFENDRDTILRYMLQNNWRVYEFRGQGKVRPLDDASASDAGRNIMCVKGECDLVKFYPSEDAGVLYHEFFHIGIRSFHYLEFLFSKKGKNQFVFDEEKDIRRDLSKAILFNGDIPYLAPEIALLYKSSQVERGESYSDFEQIYPHMSDEQKEWFSQKLDILYPGGHQWRVCG
ncbi:MAG: hypothetical protein E7458_09320 [Ruminococcaceae bacterium]|nr:hypothetical protein [Oscillospiraceae bacterium]